MEIRELELPHDIIRFWIPTESEYTNGISNFKSYYEIRKVSTPEHPNHVQGYTAKTEEPYRKLGYYRLLTEYALNYCHEVLKKKGLLYVPKMVSIRNPPNLGYRSEISDLLLDSWHKKFDMEIVGYDDNKPIYHLNNI